MRRAAQLAAIATGLALLSACAEPSPTAEADDPRDKPKKSYNRREIESPSPGVFTGRDGVWRIERSDRRPPEPTSPPPCEVESDCERDADRPGDPGE